MTGRRARGLLRDDMESRFYRLGQFLGYFHEDRDGTPEQVLEAAIADYPVELRQQVRRELAAVMTEYPEDDDLRTVLNDGLGVNVYFRKPEEARQFAAMVQQRLFDSIEAHFASARAARRPQS